MNRRGFFSTLFALPVAAVAAAYIKPVPKVKFISSRLVCSGTIPCTEFQWMSGNLELLGDLKGNRYRTFTVDPHGKITASEKA